MEPIVARSGHPGPSLKVLFLAALVVFGSLLLVNGILYVAKVPFSLYSVKEFLMGTLATDSWVPMRAASEWFKQAHSTTLYQDIFFGQNIKFQYPPSSLLVFSAFDALGIPTRDSMFTAIGWFAVFVTAAAVAAQSLLMVYRATPMRLSVIIITAVAVVASFIMLMAFPALAPYGLRPTQSVLDAWIGLAAVIAVFTVAAAIAAYGLRLFHSIPAMQPDAIITGFVAGFAVVVTLTFYPILRPFVLGQAQTWLNAWFALAVVCWLLGWRFLAGALIGLICMIKPQFGLFLIWGLLRRQWHFVTGLLVVAVPLTLVSLVLYGFDNHLDYLATLQFISRHGESFYANQSINGLLNRLFENGDNIKWDAGAFPPYNAVIHYATLASSLVILALALFYRARENPGCILDFLIAALSFTVASPVAWEHHYGILPPILVALFLTLVNLPASRQRTMLFAFLAVTFVLSANVFPISRGVPNGVPSLVQSYLLFAGLSTLWLLYKLRGQAPVTERNYATPGIRRVPA